MAGRAPDAGAAEAAVKGSSAAMAEIYLPNYRMGKTLGIGSFGKVKVAEHILTGHKVAVKILNRKKIKAIDMEEKVRREIKILRLFMHPHIIRLYEVLETPHDIYVVMEYVKSGELFDYIVEKGRLGENEARHFFQQIVSGVEYCHRNMVVHRDLKPENLLLDAKSNVKIADFGLSNVMRDGHFLKTSCGSPNYAAPEVISGKLYSGPEVDVWSCGVILYALLCGSLPFDDESIPNLFKKIKGGVYTLPSHLSPGARDLIARALLVDPLKRVTVSEIRAHPWFVVHLPRYLVVPPPDTLAQATNVDAETLEMVVNLGFEREHVVDALRHQLRNKATVAYFLLLDNRRNLFGGYLGAEFEAGELPQRRGSVGDAHGVSGVGVGPRRPSQVQAHLMQQRLVAEQRWMLGSTTRMAPAEVMAEIFRVLRYMNVSWKKLGPYNLKCLYKLAAVAVHGEGGDVAHAGGVRAETGGGGEEDSAMDDGGHNTAPGITHIITATMRPLSPLPAAATAALLMILGLQESVSGQEDGVGLPAGSDAILSSPYVDSFSCEGQAYGYFADVQNNCEVFHICYPLTDETGRITEYLKWSFFCGNGTVFDQFALVCNHPEDAFPCEESPSLYGATQYGLVEDDLDYY